MSVSTGMVEEKLDLLSLTDDEENEDSDYEPALPELLGILSKWTNYLHGWQDRYIVLKDGTLSYYKSENDTAFGCRGAVSLSAANVIPHQFDECRFDVSVNDCMWYLRTNSEDDRSRWISAIELHRLAESGYGSENNLRRHGSLLSLQSGTSLSTISASSFKEGPHCQIKEDEFYDAVDVLFDIVEQNDDEKEGPHCQIKEDEFYDAGDVLFDIVEQNDDEKKKIGQIIQPEISLSPTNRLYNEINKITNEHVARMTGSGDGDSQWRCIAEEGDLKVYTREIEINGVVVDPFKAYHTVKGFTGYEVCHHFWDNDVRMNWDLTLDSTVAVERPSEDTVIVHDVIKRVWPASQRDALFWSHKRHLPGESDICIVVNCSTSHPKVLDGKYTRITMNAAMICQTIIEPPSEGEITRDNITCKISYTADVNPGGWVPPSLLRTVYKKKYLQLLKTLTEYVRKETADKPIMFE